MLPQAFLFDSRAFAVPYFSRDHSFHGDGVAEQPCRIEITRRLFDNLPRTILKIVKFSQVFCRNIRYLSYTRSHDRHFSGIRELPERNDEKAWLTHEAIYSTRRTRLDDDE